MAEDFRIKRKCPRCRYSIYPGFRHIEISQPEGASHFVCRLERVAPGLVMSGPLVEVLKAYLDSPS